MFKNSSFEDEIYRSMEKKLVSNQTESKHGLKRIAQAADYLNAAAEIFDQAGMTEQSKETTQVLHSLAVENFSLSDLAGLSEEDMHNILEMSTPGQLALVAKKVSNVASGESSMGDEVKSSLKEMDMSDPEVRSKWISKIMSALKVAKFFV